MFSKKIRRVLSFIGRAKVSGSWFIGGSVGQELAGVKDRRGHEDFDIMVDAKTAKRFLALFKPENPVKTKDSVSFIFRGVPIELCIKYTGLSFFARVIKSRNIRFLSLSVQIERHHFVKNLKKARLMERYLRKHPELA